MNPSLPVVRELVARGDAITCYSTERYAVEIEQAGGRFRPYRDAFLTDLSQLPSQTDELSWLLMRTSAGALESELETIRAERPAYVIADSVAPWGQWVGRIVGVPVVTSVPTFAFNRHVMAFGLAHGVRPKSAKRVLSKLRYMSKAFRLRRRLCRRYDVTGPGVMESVMGHSDLNIVYTSRQFQPCAETFDSRYQFIGPMTTRTETATLPWDQVLSPDVVYVSLGTLFNTDTAFYQRCFEAFAGQPFHVVLSTGEHVSRESLGAVPPNFIVQPHVPQLAVLLRARAFVTHGGMNSVNESLAHGVPMVVVPQMGEQAIVGRQVEHLGAGICLTKEECTPATLRDSVRRVLTENRFREHAAVLRQSFQGAGGAARAADAILAFTRGASQDGGSHNLRPATVRESPQ